MATTPAPLDRQQQHLRELHQRREMHHRAMMVPGPDNYAAHAQPRTMSSRSYNNGGMAKPLIWATPFQQLTSQLFDRVVDHVCLCCPPSEALFSLLSLRIFAG